jgi:hypothetical protein
LGRRDDGFPAIRRNAKLWGLTDAELDEVRQALELLK